MKTQYKIALAFCLLLFLIIVYFLQQMENRLPISAGILTHYAPKTLLHTLENYKKAGLFDCVNDVFVVIQHSERQMQERDVCKLLNVRYILLPDNGKMASGFKTIYENAYNDTLLFLENDFIINTSKTETYTFLSNALHFLNKYDYVKGRSRNNAGVPNYAVNMWSHESPTSFINHTHLSESIYWDKNPELTYIFKISKITPKYGNEAWYTSSSKSCNYTNNPYLCKREFFKSEIYPHLIHGENIEDRLTPIWATKDYKCVFGPGLFTHDRSYDGHT